MLHTFRPCSLSASTWNCFRSHEAFILECHTLNKINKVFQRILFNGFRSLQKLWERLPVLAWFLEALEATQEHDPLAKLLEDLETTQKYTSFSHGPLILYKTWNHGMLSRIVARCWWTLVCHPKRLGVSPLIMFAIVVLDQHLNCYIMFDLSQHVLLLTSLLNEIESQLFCKCFLGYQMSQWNKQ